MKKKVITLVAVALLGLGSTVQASLIDRGNGLIYDNVLDVTWLQDANYAQTSGFDFDGQMDWTAANAWADGLVYQGYDDWRLPTLGPINGMSFQLSATNNASTDVGWAKTTTNGTDGGWRDSAGNPVSEMGYMYYVNLENKGYCTPNDATPTNCVEQAGYGLNNTNFVDGITGDTHSFFNVQFALYWSGLEFAPNPSFAWAFDFRDGYSLGSSNQTAGNKDSELIAWAVRPGDVTAAPEPGTVVLMALGLVGLGVGRRMRRAT